MRSTIHDHLLSSVLRPIALAVSALVLATSSTACDADDSARPTAGAAWMVQQLEDVRDLSAQEQAEHFAAYGEQLALTRALVEPQPRAPQLALSSGEAPPPVELMPACDLQWVEGCVDWNAQQGCVDYWICMVCGDWYSCNCGSCGA